MGRPLDDLVGQDEARAALRAVASRGLSGARIALVGPEGTGRSTAAALLAEETGWESLEVREQDLPDVAARSAGTPTLLVTEQDPGSFQVPDDVAVAVVTSREPPEASGWTVVRFCAWTTERAAALLATHAGGEDAPGSALFGRTAEEVLSDGWEARRDAARDVLSAVRVAADAEPGAFMDAVDRLSGSAGAPEAAGLVAQTSGEVAVSARWSADCAAGMDGWLAAYRFLRAVRALGRPA